MKKHPWLLGIVICCSLVAVAAEPSAQVAREISRLRELKRTKPEAYEAEIQRLRKGLHSKMNRMKEKEPERYQQLDQRMRRHRQERQEQMGRSERRGVQEQKGVLGREQMRQDAERRLKVFKQKNPAKYEELMRHREQWRSEMRERKGRMRMRESARTQHQGEGRKLRADGVGRPKRDGSGALVSGQAVSTQDDEEK